jgi:hypothetical protein
LKNTTHQEHLLSPEHPDSETSPGPQLAERRPRRQPPLPGDRPAPRWLQRLSVTVLVVFCFYVGFLMLVLPWSRYWQENHLLLVSSTWGPIFNSGAFRGAVSGLGLLDIWIGISEIIQYRERRR